MRAPTGVARAALRRPGWVVGGVVAATVLVLAGWLAGRSIGQATPQPSPSASEPTTPVPLSPSQIAAQLAPSLVAISTDPGPGAAEPDGTGLVISERAAILTALHVVDGASLIRVSFADGTSTTAALVDADEERDIATLIPAELPVPVVPAVLGTAQALVPGAEVVALGNPLGLTASVTSGVVSGLDRTARSPGGGSLTGLIQFDAAVNPGSSGGPLVDSSGATVGIVVAVVNPTGDRTFIGVGLAVPIQAALGGAGGPQK